MEHSGTGWERMELLQDGAQWDVVKQAEDLLLLDLLGRGVFGRRRDWWAFPKLWVGGT